MRQNFARPALIAVAVAAAARVAVAQQPPVPAKPVDARGGELVTRVFDVRDLTFVAPNYPLGGSLVSPTHIPTAGAATAATAGGGGGGGGNQTLFSNGGGEQPKLTTVSTTAVEGIRRLLVETVDPPSWGDNGGKASITATDAGLLFVTQTPAGLQRVAAQLDGLRGGRTGMVRVRADWVLLPAGEVRRLFKNGPTDTAALPEVDRAALDAVPHASASLACMSGQTVHLTSGPARSFVGSATPVVAPGAIAFDLQQTIVQYGLALQVTPTLGGDTATLDLTSVASRAPDAPAATAATPVASATTRPVSGDAIPPVTVTAPSGIDRFAATVQGLQTTAQVPVNRPVLVGGMTLDAGVAGPGGAELYLVVEADTGR